MEYVRLGPTGLKVSRICVGCLSFGGGGESGLDEWGLSLEESKPIVKRAIDLGLNFFDTADKYSYGKSEEILGKSIEGYRDSLVISTKVCYPVGPGPNDQGLSRKHIRDSFAKSLKRLGTDYVDLYYIHRMDPESEIEDVLRTLNDLVHSEGKVNYIGATTMWAWQFENALGTSDKLGLERFAVMQNHYNLIYREEEREMIPLCNAEGVGMVAWAPLAKGFLSGKYQRGKKPEGRRYEMDPILRNRYFTDQNFEILDRVKEVAKAKGVKPAQVAVAWILQKEGFVGPVVSFTKVQQVEDMVEATTVKLTSDDLKRLEEPYKPHDVQGFA